VGQAYGGYHWAAVDVIGSQHGHRQGFTPELLLTFPLPGRSDEFFYEVCWGSRRMD